MSKTPKYLIWVPVLLAITAMAGIGFGVKIGTARQIRRTAVMQRGMGTSMPAIVDEGWYSSEYTDDKL
ncbi:MAG: hypothetical protein K2J31_07630, partial [Alistipes sp.]|nr:hypothetical protein [Alistipes sp.]